MKTHFAPDRNWEEHQRLEFEEYLRHREEHGPPPKGPQSNADYINKYQDNLLKRRPSQGGHQPGSIEDYRKQYESSTRRDSTSAPPPPPGSNLDYIRMYEETLKRKVDTAKQQSEERFEKFQQQNRSQEEYKRFYEEELRRKQAVEHEQEEYRRRVLEEQSKQRENINRSREQYQQQIVKDMQKKQHLITTPTELRPERVGAQAQHWEHIAAHEESKMRPYGVPPSPRVHRKDLDACWPPKREDGVLIRPAFSRENSFHGSSKKVYQWPPPRSSSMDRDMDYDRPPTPSGQIRTNVAWNQQHDGMRTPPPFTRSPVVGRKSKNVQWPPASPTSEQKPSFAPSGSRRGSSSIALEDYLHQQQTSHIPATYRPPPGSSHHEGHTHEDQF